MLPDFLKSTFSYDWLRRLSDARNWAGMGCSEVRIPGKHGTGVTPVYVNVMKLLELAFHDGYNPNTGKCLCPSRL
ncbi:pyruvate formate lyase family protein [Anaeromassilibacillus sp. SJQ-1]|uniref:pyruvate formate lyase family protein n=1 Tax=Anaeromassilibacillus sp. SJQ-1 TaxID=3375419 RepID=UPI003989B1C0